MDAQHEGANREKGVREHVDELNQKFFGKNKLFRNKDHLEAHARKGMRNQLHSKRKAMYREHKHHQTRLQNGEL